MMSTLYARLAKIPARHALLATRLVPVASRALNCLGSSRLAIPSVLMATTQTSTLPSAFRVTRTVRSAPDHCIITVLVALTLTISS